MIVRTKHLKGWLKEERKKEREKAASDQETLPEGTPAGPDRTGGEETEERREKTPAEMKNRRGWWP